METLEYLLGDVGRSGAAVCAVLAYALFCYVLYRRSRSGRVIAGEAAGTGKPVWVIYASQTGQAESIAQRTARALRAGGEPVRLCRLDQPWLEEVAGASRVYFIVSTYGEGDAPDHALGFARNALKSASQPALQGLRFGLLALGDKSYSAYCAFGRSLDQWLQESGAVAEFERIEVDRLDPQALAAWHQQMHTPGADVLEIPAEPAYAEWRLLKRRCLNIGGPGQAMFKVVLQPVAGAAPTWQAGDLVDVLIPGGDGRPRSYSISNLAGDGQIELIVRTYLRDNGLPGEASGWFNRRSQLGDTVLLRLRHNPSFNLAQDLARPLILIGAGTGIAGLRGHLQARAKAIADSGLPAPERSAWLLYGERSGRHDRPCHVEIGDWHRKHVLTKLDLSFSRDDPLKPYIQHHLQEQAATLRDWVASGADILICGCAKTMAQGVDQALRSALGGDVLEQMLAAGRIRRDIF